MTGDSLVSRVLEILPPDKWQQHKIILGVSGGADSVALTRLLRQISQQQKTGKIIVGHANHQMRGKESDQDEQFVQSLCKNLNFEFVAKQLPLPKLQVGDGIESALRNLRYQFFRDLANQHSARYVMTAHTADDQAETILFRVLRGTGISGLAGIPTQRVLCQGVTLIRPLLKISRKEIEAYLEDLGQPFQNDSSNSELDFSRNQIRHQLVPLLRSQFHCKIEARLQPLATLAREYQELLDELTDKALDRCNQESRQRCRVDKKHLENLSCLTLRHLLVRIWKQKQWPLQSMTFDKWQELAELILTAHKKGQTSKLMLPGKISFQVTNESVVIEKA